MENTGPLLENASAHTRVATVTVSLSPHTSLVGDPVILNVSPVVHPFVLSRRFSHLWDVSMEADSISTPQESSMIVFSVLLSTACLVWCVCVLFVVCFSLFFFF